jgi:hypothetical protein
MAIQVCGFFYTINQIRKYLPQVKLQAHTTILSSVSRTTLTQTFVNPDTQLIKELRYVFPLYDGVAVVAFTCTVGDRVIKGVVKEKQKARQVFDAAVQRGETAGLLEQLDDASDVFTTTVGNIPAGVTIRVEIEYLGELKHDAEVDGIRFTIPTSIAPRYGSYPGELLKASPTANVDGGITIVVDAEMPTGSAIKSVQSPSHPISVSVGTTSISPNAEPSLQMASATLSLGSAELEKDFILQVVATNTANPVAMLEQHPTIPAQRAIMATLVPKFALPPSRPEIVFVCDRSGSMGDGKRIPNLVSALKVFLKSLPVGVKFNICSFGSSYSFLWDKSRSYDKSALDEAMRHVQTFQANFGGTEMFNPVHETLKRRYADMDLEVFVITDGEIWDQQRLFTMLNEEVEKSKGAIRVFTLGIGRDVSHALIEGVARAGNGFAQTVSEDEKMDGKVVRMLKGALSPHVKDYTLEIKYDADNDGDFEMVDKVEDALKFRVPEAAAPKSEQKQKVISLFDPEANPDAEIKNTGDKFGNLPAVKVPTILQTPAKIPPLFPFSRTNVYLLLSPDSTPKTPRSVILRGTSPQGPLELEIPITVATPGATIHQLAAKKAVQELEEGRGWLYAAQDADGTLLSKKHEGRFSDMVEREAVRLGVQFQVGGKWCSFVAVEGSDEQIMEDESRGPVADEKFDESLLTRGCTLDTLSDKTDTLAVSAQRFRRSASPKNSFMSSLSSIGSSIAPSKKKSSGGMGSFFSSAKSSDRFSVGSAPPPPPAPAFAMAAGPPGPGAMPSMKPAGSIERSIAPPMESLSMDYSNAGYQPPPPKLMRMSRQHEVSVEREERSAAPRTGGFGGGRGGSFAKLKSAKVLAADQDDEGLEDASMEMERGGPAGSPLDALVGLQSFDGFWAWSDKLLKVVGASQASIDSATKQSGEAWTTELAGKRDAMATAVVLVFLKTKLAGERDSWEMMADKALDWLKGELKADVDIAQLVKVFGGLF